MGASASPRVSGRDPVRVSAARVSSIPVVARSTSETLSSQAKGAARRATGHPRRRSAESHGGRRAKGSVVGSAAPSNVVGRRALSAADSVLTCECARPSRPADSPAPRLSDQGAGSAMTTQVGVVAAESAGKSRARAIAAARGEGVLLTKLMPRAVRSELVVRERLHATIPRRHLSPRAIGTAIRRLNSATVRGRCPGSIGWTGTRQARRPKPGDRPVTGRAGSGSMLGPGQPLVDRSEGVGGAPAPRRARQSPKSRGAGPEQPQPRRI